MEESLYAKSELFDELHPVNNSYHYDLPPRPHTAMSGSLHSTSVRIVDHGVKGVNPAPKMTQSSLNSSDVQDQFLSPSRLREVSGCDNLTQITYIELSVNTSTTSVGNFGTHLPNLLQLSLIQSVVHSIRDLGTSLGCLRVLWMARCALRDLDGLAALPSLQELYIANNEVSDVSLISLLSELEVLDLESNRLSDGDQLGYLCLCQNLSILNLMGNPLADKISDSGSYRTLVRETIPHLKVLDEVPFEGVDVSSLSSVSSYSLMSASMVNVWRDVNKGLISPMSAQDKELMRRKSPVPSSPIVFSGKEKEVGSMEASSCSELTHGLNQVICGNPIRALRNRQRRLLCSQSSMALTSPPCNERPVIYDPLSLEMEGLKITRSRSKENVSYPLSLPVSPPPGAPPRPHTASDFRARRYHKLSHTQSLTDDSTREPVRDDHYFTNRQSSRQRPHTQSEEEVSVNKLLTIRTNPIQSHRVYRSGTGSNQSTNLFMI